METLIGVFASRGRAEEAVKELIEKHIPQAAKTDSNSQQSKLDSYRMRAAMQLGLVAMERAEVYGTSLPLEKEELEKLMEKS